MVHFHEGDCREWEIETSSSLGSRVCWYHRLVTPTEIESRQRKAKQNYGECHMERTARKKAGRPRESCVTSTRGHGGSFREEEGQNGLNIHPWGEGAIPFLQRKARRSQESVLVQMTRGSRSRAFVLSVLCLSEKRQGEVGSRQRSKIQSSLERDSGRETIRLCTKGMFWIYTFFCPRPKQRTLKIMECPVWSVLQTRASCQSTLSGRRRLSDSVTSSRSHNQSVEIVQKPVFSLLIHAFCEQFQAVLSRDYTPLKPVLYPFLCSPAPLHTHTSYLAACLQSQNHPRYVLLVFFLARHGPPLELAP